MVTALALLIVTGCTGDLVPLVPQGTADMASGSADMALPGGADGAAPRTVKFSPDIQQDLDAKGCSSASCHGNANTPPQLHAMATTPAEVDVNYANFVGSCNQGAPASSAVLTPWLPTGHGGGALFAGAGTSDPVYQRWLAWIQAGAAKQ